MKRSARNISLGALWHKALVDKTPFLPRETAWHGSRACLAAHANSAGSRLLWPRHFVFEKPTRTKQRGGPDRWRCREPSDWKSTRLDTPYLSLYLLRIGRARHRTPLQPVHTTRTAITARSSRSITYLADHRQSRTFPVLRSGSKYRQYFRGAWLPDPAWQRKGSRMVSIGPAWTATSEPLRSYEVHATLECDAKAEVGYLPS